MLLIVCEIGVMNLKLIHQIIEESTHKYGSHIALLDEYSGYSITYRKLGEDIKKTAGALQHLGVEKGMHIAQFSENNSRWMVIDQAIAKCGAVNIVRGSLAPIEELKYIYKHSDSVALVTDSYNVIDSLKDFLVDHNCKFIIYTGSEKTEKPSNSNVTIMSFDELLEMGEKIQFNEVEINGNDVATLIYSSGTTGNPKGIMLTHNNLASQLLAVPHVLTLKETKTVTLVLPIWHAYERICEYYLLSIGTKNCYTNVKNFKKDLQKYKPHYLVSVPRIWESIYENIYAEINKKSSITKNLINFFINTSKKFEQSNRILNGNCIYNQYPSIVQKIECLMITLILSPIHSLAKNIVYSKFKNAIGGRFTKGISGGGALAKHIDDFFLAVGIDIYVGYGLTETSPVVSVRVEGKNKAYAVGPAMLNTEFLIADPDSYSPVKKGEKGIVLIKGPQVMKGYYKDEENSKKVLLPNGFFVSGDIGWMTDDGTLVLTGRAKDVIVLSNGENVEPEAIEQSCMTSPFVKQIVLAGQDKNALSALVVPNIEAIEELAKKKKINTSNPLKNNELKNEILKELRKKVQERTTFRSHERLANIEFVAEDFTPENGLMTQTAKIKKNEVYERYKQTIEAMYN